MPKTTGPSSPDSLSSNPAALREAKDRGARLYAEGKLEAALAAFQVVVKAAPQEIIYRHKVAEVLQRLGKKSEAIAEYLAEAEAWARTGWLLRAIAACKVILQIDPGHAGGKKFLAELYDRRDRPRSTQAPSLLPAAEKPPEAHGGGEAQPSGPIPLFSALGREEFTAVLWKMERRLFQPGETVVREGEPGTSMFVIVDGAVDVVRQMEDGQGKAVARMGEGEFFGEMALVVEGPRLASVVAVETTEVLELTRARLAEVIAHHPSVGEVVQQFFRERLLTNVMRSNPLFAELPEDLRRPVMEAFTPLSVKEGEQILERGRPSQALYLLLRGRCTVFHEHVDGRETPYPEMAEGDVFGEISLLRSGLVTASVRAATACTLLKLEREAFEQLLASRPELRQKLGALGSERLHRTSRLLSGRTIHQGDTRV
jgi:CRP-like cAMP-binding protein